MGGYFKRWGQNETGISVNWSRNDLIVFYSRISSNTCKKILADI